MGTDGIVLFQPMRLLRPLMTRSWMAVRCVLTKRDREKIGMVGVGTTGFHTVVEETAGSHSLRSY